MGFNCISVRALLSFYIELESVRVFDCIIQEHLFMGVFFISIRQSGNVTNGNAVRYKTNEPL